MPRKKKSKYENVIARENRPNDFVLPYLATSGIKFLTRGGEGGVYKLHHS